MTRYEIWLPILASLPENLGELPLYIMGAPYQRSTWYKVGGTVGRATELGELNFSSSSQAFSLRRNPVFEGNTLILCYEVCNKYN